LDHRTTNLKDRFLQKEIKETKKVPKNSIFISFVPFVSFFKIR